MNLTKRIVALLLIGVMIFSFSACRAVEEEEVIDPKKMTPEQKMEISELLYPATTDTFRYNVYTHYIAITEFLDESTENKNITIPDELPDNDGNKIPVYAIEKTAFAGTEIESVTMGKNVITIEEKAFYNCPNLTNVTFSDSVKNIGTSAFRECLALQNITLNEAVESIGNYAFAKCENLTTVKLSESLSIMGTSCFSNCIRLQEVTIPNTLSAIPEKAFYKCISLVNVIINSGENPVVIKGSAFSGCKNLKNVWIPENVSEISSYAFDTNVNDYDSKNKEKTNGATLYSSSKSTAAIYAAKNLLNFTLVTEKEFKEIAKKTAFVNDPIEITNKQIENIVNAFDVSSGDYDKLEIDITTLLEKLVEDETILSNFIVKITDETVDNSETINKHLVVTYSTADFGDGNYEKTF